MKKQLSLSLCVLLLITAWWAGAQSTLTLNQTTELPKVDGIITAGEYSLITEVADMRLDLRWTTDTLYVAVSGQTSGWVAVGLGSAAMDGAVMYIGFVTGDKAQLKVQQGARHSHTDIDTNAPLEYSMKETAGQTVLELALDASQFIDKGQKKLELIIAMGGADSFLSMHKAKANISVNLAQ